MIQRAVLACALALGGCAFGDDLGSSAGDLSVTDQCEIAGMGVLPSGDAASGSIVGTDLGATGGWTHHSVTHGVILATPDWVLCRINGARLGDFAGAATLAGVPGYEYRVSVQDRGTPGDPTIVPGTPTIETLSATRSYRPTRSIPGSLAITADLARVTIPAELPVTEGAPGNGMAVITLTRADTLDTVRCRYHGNGVRNRGGDAYVLRHCVGRAGSPELLAGDAVDVSSLTLHVQSGDSHSSGCSSHTTVELELEVTPLTVIEPARDFYRIALFDSTGAEVLVSEGTLASGDFEIVDLSTAP